MIELIYDTPIEVNAKQYSTLMNECSGLVCGRIENGKYYIKAWLEISHVQEVLNRIK